MQLDPFSKNFFSWISLRLGVDKSNFKKGRISEFIIWTSQRKQLSPLSGCLKFKVHAIYNLKGWRLLAISAAKSILALFRIFIFSIFFQDIPIAIPAPINTIPDQILPSHIVVPRCSGSLVNWPGSIYIYKAACVSVCNWVKSVCTSQILPWMDIQNRTTV